MDDRFADAILNHEGENPYLMQPMDHKVLRRPGEMVDEQWYCSACSRWHNTGAWTVSVRTLSIEYKCPCGHVHTSQRPS